MLLALLLLACAPASVGMGTDTASPGDSTPDSGDETGDETGEADCDGFAGQISLSVDEDVVTVVRASWDGAGLAEAWVEYRFEGDSWRTAPAVEAGHAVILGVPELTEVEARLVAAKGGGECRGEEAAITTGSLPPDLLRPSIDAWDPSIASDAPYALVSVAGGEYTFSGPYWIEIFDRDGRVVWYREVGGNMNTLYASVAFDGTHVWYDVGDIFGMGQEAAHVVRTTLDGRWSHEVEMADLGQAVGEGPDGSFYYERRAGTAAGLVQVDAAGTATQVWDCTDWMREHRQDYYMCWANTTNWSADRDTVLVSGFYSDTVFEIDVASGEPIRQMGQLTAGEPYTFSPPDSMFRYQHFPNWTEAGTLLVSTHSMEGDGIQVAAEYEVDGSNETLTLVWSYVSTDIWATQLGEATRLANGNTVQGYGQDGAVREVTADGETAWQASWEKDFYDYRVIGHFSFIDDLYALNRGPEG